jgi:hypothetical protein
VHNSNGRVISFSNSIDLNLDLKDRIGVIQNSVGRMCGAAIYGEVKWRGSLPNFFPGFRNWLPVRTTSLNRNSSPSQKIGCCRVGFQGTQFGFVLGGLSSRRVNVE